MQQFLTPIGVLLATENWELARQAIDEMDLFERDKRIIEHEFGVHLSDVESLYDLPHASFQELKKRLLDAVQRFLDESHDDLYRKICVEFDYCRKKEQFGWRVAEYLLGAVDIFWAQGGASLVALAIKTEMLDKLCKCK